MKERGFNLSDKTFYVLVAIVIFAAIAVGVYAATTGLVAPINPGHNSTQVFIPVGNGKYITLQNAIDSGYLAGINSSAVNTTLLPPSSPYHLASQILITVNSFVMTLQDAINNKVFISGATKSYNTTLPAGGEYFYNINVNTTGGVMTLQNAIINNKIASTACFNQPLGTSCGTNLACDGSGHCLGWSGTGCGQCPFGAAVYTPYCDPRARLICPTGYNYCTNTYNPSSVSAECSYLGSCGIDCGRGIICPQCTINTTWTMVP
jgi:hypothetical protein